MPEYAEVYRARTHRDCTAGPLSIFPANCPRFCPQISLQNVYLMTPSNGVVEGEGAQIRLWPSGQQFRTCSVPHSLHLWEWCAFDKDLELA